MGGVNNPYTATPKTIGLIKKCFYRSGKVITYKNDVKIRISFYEIKKDKGATHNPKHNMITFEGKTYYRNT